MNFSALILRGLRADQPLATAAAAGALYHVTDEGVTERSTGAAWESYSSAAAGDVVGPSPAVDGEVALYDSTTGKLLKRATGTGIVRVTSGVYGTPGAVNLASEVTGDLPFANLTAASAASKLLGRGSASGAGDYQEITIGSGLTMTATTLSAAGGGDALVANPLSQFAATTSAQLAGVLSDETGSGAAVFATSPTLVTPALGTPTAVVLTNATGLPLSTGVTGDLPLSNLAQASAASRLLGRGSASGAGDFEELTISTGLTLTGTVLTASGTGTPAGASYVTLGTDATLTSERVLTGTSNQITVTDGGAGSTVTLATPQNIGTSSTPQFGRMGLNVAADSSAKLKIAGQYGSTTVAAGNSSTSKTLDWDDGNTQLLTLTGNCTLTLSNPKDGFRYLIVLLQDGTGSRLVTWPSGVKWAAGTAPTLTTTAGHADIVTLVYCSGLGASGNYLAAANLNYTPA